MCIQKRIVLLILMSVAGFVHAEENVAEVAKELPVDVVKSDLKTAHPVYLRQLKAAPEKREEYAKNLYFDVQLEKRIQKEGLDQSYDVLAALKRAKRKIYIEALLDKEVKDARADIEELAKEYYEVKKDKFKTRPKAKFSVIFMKKGETKEENEKIKQQMEEILEELKAHPGDAELFAKLAKQYSQDRFAKQGGFNRKWVFPPADLERSPKLVQAAFALNEPGQISDIVENSQGYTIFMLMAYTPSVPLDFEHVKEDLIRSIESDFKVAKEKALYQQLSADEDMPVDVDLLNQLVIEEENRRNSTEK